MPEATILAEQMRAELTGRRLAGWDLRDCDSLQRVGFVNEDREAFWRLTGRGDICGSGEEGLAGHYLVGRDFDLDRP
jgi:hypothetical protein